MISGNFCCWLMGFFAQVTDIFRPTDGRHIGIWTVRVVAQGDALAAVSEETGLRYAYGGKGTHFPFRLTLRNMSSTSLEWRHNGVSNHGRLDCLLNRLFSCRSKQTWKLCVTGLCEGNPPVTGGFPSHRASNAENISTWWRHHVFFCTHFVDYDNM